MTTLGYALLGLLARNDLSGYDITLWMRAPIGFFWHASHSQIYPELARLEGEAMVTHRVVEQQDRPDKKIYSITQAGKTALAAWVLEPPTASPPRDELVLKTFSLWLADPERAPSLFREQERKHAGQLAAYLKLKAAEDEAILHETWGITSPRLASYATLMRGIGYEREYAEWCGWVAGLLEKLLPSDEKDRERSEG